MCLRHRMEALKEILPISPSPAVLAETMALGQGRQSLCGDGCWCVLLWMLLLLFVLSKRATFLLCCREKMIYSYQL